MLKNRQSRTYHYLLHDMPAGKAAFLFILFFSFIRLFAAGSLELGNDEAYYWLYSRHLQWNYFDHPPMVALWIRIFTLDQLFQNTFFLRLGSVVSIACSSWFLFRTVTTFSSERAGLFSLILLHCSFYAGITAGIYIMPDTPQLFFWTLGLWMLARICRDPQSWMNWIGFGLASGLCIMSKVHGVFLWFGLGSYIVFQRGRWLRLPQLYVSAVIAIIIASPIFFWNLQNDFITWRFHSHRVSLGGKWNAKAFFRELLAQAGFNNPLNVILIFLGIKGWRREAKRNGTLHLFLFIGIPLAFILLFIAMWRPTLPHWSGPAYVSMLPFAGVFLDKKIPARFPSLIRWCMVIFISVLFTCWMFVKYYPGTTGQKNLMHYGHGDVSLDMYGWRAAGKQFAAYYHQETESGRIKLHTPVVCSYWWGAHVEYYFCRPAHAEMIGLGPLPSIHHYAWMNALRKDSVQMEEAFCILPSDEKPSLEKLKNYYNKATLVKTIGINRSGRAAHYFFIYRLEGWRGTIPYVP